MIFTQWDTKNCPYLLIVPSLLFPLKFDFVSICFSVPHHFQFVSSNHSSQWGLSWSVVT